MIAVVRRKLIFRNRPDTVVRDKYRGKSTCMLEWCSLACSACRVRLRVCACACACAWRACCALRYRSHPPFSFGFSDAESRFRHRALPCRKHAQTARICSARVF